MTVGDGPRHGIALYSLDNFHRGLVVYKFLRFSSQRSGGVINM